MRTVSSDLTLYATRPLVGRGDIITKSHLGSRNLFSGSEVACDVRIDAFSSMAVTVFLCVKQQYNDVMHIVQSYHGK